MLGKSGSEFVKTSRKMIGCCSLLTKRRETQQIFEINHIVQIVDVTREPRLRNEFRHIHAFCKPFEPPPDPTPERAPTLKPYVEIRRMTKDRSSALRKSHSFPSKSVPPWWLAKGKKATSPRNQVGSELYNNRASNERPRGS